MPMTLTLPVALTATVTAFRITSFAVDLTRQEIHVAYDEQDSSGAVIQKKLLSLIGPDFAAAIAASDAAANAMPAGTVSTYGALKTALYEQITALTGFSGTVV